MCLVKAKDADSCDSCCEEALKFGKRMEDDVFRYDCRRACKLFGEPKRSVEYCASLETDYFACWECCRVHSFQIGEDHKTYFEGCLNKCPKDAPSPAPASSAAPSDSGGFSLFE
ncbi:MAG: hypothetical protein R3B54_05555 [Bdellovibrionota bacterium]